MDYDGQKTGRLAFLDGGRGEGEEGEREGERVKRTSLLR